MKLIVGLGNPGLKYRRTRHNAGFIVIESLAKKHSIRIRRKLYSGLSGESRICGKGVFLLLPQTFMNLSGESIRPAVGRVSDLSDMLVVSDDIDLMLGRLRFRPKGSSGGHKGLKSVIDNVGTEEFHRLRVGIKPEYEVLDTSDFVLRPFAKNEKGTLKEVINRAVDSIETWIVEGIETCMTRYNGRTVDIS